MPVESGVDGVLTSEDGKAVQVRFYRIILNRMMGIKNKTQKTEDR